MLLRFTRWALEMPKRVAAGVALLALGAAIVGVPVLSELSAGGFADPGSESSQANRLLDERFGKGDVPLIVTVSGSGSEQAGRRVVQILQASPHVSSVMSPWTSDPRTAQALSGTGASLVVADLRGGERDAPTFGEELADQIDRDVAPQFPQTVIQAGGPAMVFAQITDQTLRDALVMESIAVPLSLVVLVWVFGGVAVAMLPVVVAGVAIAVALAMLRLINQWSDISIFALNLVTALGLALAIDYTLLIVSRFRDEVAGGAAAAEAMRTTMTTAGRTIVFSALTVGLSMSALLLFDVAFLTSFGYAGIVAVVASLAAALVLSPAMMVLLGPRVTRRRGRHRRQRTDSVEHRFWFRSTEFVMRHALPVAVAVTALLVCAGLPFLGVQWGNPDDRVLPESASAHQVGDRLRAEFTSQAGTETIVVLPDAAGLDAQDWQAYGEALSRVTNVTAVATPAGAFVDGRAVGPAATGYATSETGDSAAAYLTVSGDAALLSGESDAQLRELRAVPGPDGRAVLMTGAAAVNRDSIDSVAQTMPVALGLTVAVVFAVLFALTRSLVLPVKAVVLNVLSLTAAFGVLVWVFQEGHLWALGTTPTGTLVTTIPVLLFCIAFGLSMDYEVFILARIREIWLGSQRTAADHDRSVALGLAYTGRVVTAAALVMTISFAGLIASQVSFMRMFGVGLVLAVLADATIVRMVLLPAYMKLLGRFNWWSPWRSPHPRDRADAQAAVTSL